MRNFWLFAYVRLEWMTSDGYHQASGKQTPMVLELACIHG